MTETAATESWTEIGSADAQGNLLATLWIGKTADTVQLAKAVARVEACIADNTPGSRVRKAYRLDWQRPVGAPRPF